MGNTSTQSDFQHSIAFIGSRDLTQFPEETKILYSLSVQWAVASGFIVKTGAAPGFDQLAAEVALESGGSVLLILPRGNFQSPWFDEMVSKHAGRVEKICYDPDNPTHVPWMESVTKYHPTPHILKPYMFQLHARNYGIVKDCVAVIAAPRGLEEGGTGQGVRICRGEGIKLYNLSLKEDRETLLRRMEINDDGTPR